MTNLRSQVKWSADVCRIGRLSRRGFVRGALALARSVPVAMVFPEVIGMRPAAARPTPPTEPLHCTFCNKTQNNVQKLIAGPGVLICDECVEVCNEIIADARRLSSSAARCAMCERPVSGDVVVSDHYLCGPCATSGAPAKIVPSLPPINPESRMPMPQP
jgi:hypothetical protein